MIHNIRKSRYSKIIASYLAIQLVLTTVQPSNLFALTSGPSQPEFNSFTPIGTSDMVNLSTGDFNYNIPIMDVGGYPLNLSYNSGITMDQEASWVGLGWNLNVGQINRQVRGIPDDFKGDTLTYKKNIKKHVTVGINASVGDLQVFGLEQEDNIKAPKKETNSFSAGLGIKYSNYHGITITPSYGLSFDLSDNISVGMDVQNSATEGATISPKINAKANLFGTDAMVIGGNLNAGVSYNSNRGLTNFSLNASLKPSFDNWLLSEILDKTNTGTATGSISFSNPMPITPRKRSAFKDINGTFSFSTGIDIMAADGQLELSATYTEQELKDKLREEKAYGYEFTGQASPSDILDYNRENDRVISDRLLALPYTNYTYDVYSVNGQGISGMFRPHRSQIGQIYDEYVEDESSSASLGAESHGGTGSFQLGLNLVLAPSKSHTGIWNTNATHIFNNENENLNTSERLDYEPVYFKYVGENKVDDERELYTSQLHGDKAMAVKIGGIEDRKYADTRFRVKEYQGNIPREVFKSFSAPFKRTKRDVRNQSIQKITAAELRDFYTEDYPKNHINTHAKDHHTAEIRVLKPDGSTYVFGETAYNTTKQEVTFATDSTGFCDTGMVEYSAAQPIEDGNGNIQMRFGENSVDNTSGIDHFYDKVKTPPYAHTYLLSAVLSSDYEDLKGDGPTDDDLGAYTLFKYKTIKYQNSQGEYEDFQWRIPYGKNQASYNEGLRSNPNDQKGSYLYGKKEIKYIEKIETKTHVAFFDLSPRKDARGVDGENGKEPANGQQELYKLNTIRLYSKPEYDVFKTNNPDAEPTIDDVLELEPIKTAHFIYNYALCEGLNNNLGGTKDGHELIDEDTGILHTGKLTLKKVYFTYRTSLMGKHTPYTFDYNENDEVHNPDYSLKAFDIWGNYNPNVNVGCGTQDGITTSEFPFVDQTNKTTQNEYASAWSMTQIGLPSGGSINLTYESDDYQYVQDKHTMQMFKVVGAGLDSNPNDPTNTNNTLYGLNGNQEAEYLYIELPDETTMLSNQEFIDKYFKDIHDKPVYFRFLMNMTRKGASYNSNSRDYDYVTGYFNLNTNIDYGMFQEGEKFYAAIPMQGIGNHNENPIVKAGLYFGRTYLNNVVHGLPADYKDESIKSIAKKLAKIGIGLGSFFQKPDAKLREQQCAKYFIPEKSWIRLSTPKQYKLGGGCRVSKVEMNDNWNLMASNGAFQTYGQTYEYTLDDESSSGVASFEPNNSAENPFVEPFYDENETDVLGDRLITPRELSYVEKPFGKAFFPHSKVTYSRVTVKNLSRENIKRHATGKVVSEFYTTKDFPTKVDHTDITKAPPYSNRNRVLENMVRGLLGLKVKVENKYTLSQGYVVHTNDMDGKMKAQNVFQEDMDQPISSILYKYATQKVNHPENSTASSSILDNVLPVINRNGNIDYDREIGVDYDVITDFRESYSESKTTGINTNISTLFLGPIPVIVPTAFPSRSTHENTAHSVITTKVVHTTAILKEKIAMDLGSKVSTVNEAWDAETGEVILTKTINEFDDTYYNFNFPAYWANEYKNMGQASKNLGLQGDLSYADGHFNLAGNNNAEEYFTLGDEIIDFSSAQPQRFWVIGFGPEGTGVQLMKRNGGIVNPTSDETIDSNIHFKIIRSGYRNQQMGNMASITMMTNPLDTAVDNKLNTASFASSTNNNLRIINASAVVYNDLWNAQCENNLESIPYKDLDTESGELAYSEISEYGFNPFQNNVKGEWRAKKSYAYLTERTDIKQGAETSKTNTRKEGYFKEFMPLYTPVENSGWTVNPDVIDEEKPDEFKFWTFASEVTQYSPFGAELENKDALARYSSAQYGYNFTLPVAVTSNSRYRYMGGDNFEDYNNYLNTAKGHFTYKDIVDQDGDRGIVTSNKHAHTGHTSLLIDPENGNGAKMPVELIGEVPKPDDTDEDGLKDDEDPCPYTHPDSVPTLEDGSPDYYSCIDNKDPEISGIVISQQIRCRDAQATFTIQGKPNAIVDYAIVEHSSNPNGWFVYVNGDRINRDKNNKLRKYQIELDATGRVQVEFWLVSEKRNPGKNVNKDNAVVDFLLFKTTDGVMNPINGESVRLDAFGGRKCQGDQPLLFPKL
ncbi:hypothetical protein [Hyunsoonleella pacifica]|uniref:Uncharacterized protein n=1 Tax=Hyunsoonleella pacifica TaxID=1080224 RepID=A0A4Q9FIR7_9FLAO|nr:hypothetical protein [Hyunsoonleella pacifica]TBN11953.1 hypothetical protein EYD46_17445 [Hyunsoonleella pacifica]GGD07549.1 hypothetical protein GCM10011368_06850 [Hyunsoonleella pacifica]